MLVSPKYRLTPILWLFIFLICTVSLKARASGGITLNKGVENSFTIIENSAARLLVTNSLSQVYTNSVSDGQNEYTVLMAESYARSNRAGAPQLPVLCKLVQIPEGCIAEVHVIRYKLKEYSLAQLGITHPLYPAQPPEAKSYSAAFPLVIDRSIYETDNFYSEPLARLETAGNMRGVQLASLVISPVSYNPVTQTIRVYDSLLVEIDFSNTLKSQAAENKAGTGSPWFRQAFRDVINYRPTASAVLGSVPVKYVIVADPMFRQALQPFAQWKTRRGFRVIQAYTNDPQVGNTTTSIKAYLKNLYTTATATDPAPTFILFVGDVDQVPSFQCKNHVSDLYYCEYTGDYLPEAFFGRFSANSVAELLPQLQKTLDYEQFNIPDPSYLNQVVMVAGADATHALTWSNGPLNYLSSYYFNSAHNILDNNYMQPEPKGASYSKHIIDNLSHGVAIAAYSAHGSPEGWSDPTFTKADIAGLQNTGKYGLVVANACQTAAFDVNSFGEEMLRADKKGAMGYIGTTDLSYWDEDYWWSVGNGSVVANPTYENKGLGAYDRLFHEHGEPRSDWFSTMGQMVFAGNLAVQESNSPLKQYYWETYCLLGDPSTMIYFSVPPALTARFGRLLPPGTTHMQVTTEPNASVALSKNNMLLGVGEADENGLADLLVQTSVDPGYASLVITKQNRRPCIDSILLATPAGPYPVADGFRVRPKNTNNVPIAGDSLCLDFAVHNLGSAVTQSIVSTLTTQDKYIEIQPFTLTWPQLAAGDSAFARNAFSFHLKKDVPDLHCATATLLTRCDTGIFSTQFSFVVYAPELRHGAISIMHATPGEQVQINPGSIFFIKVPVANTGHSKSAQIVTKLFTTGQHVSIGSPKDTQQALPPGDSCFALFEVLVDNAASPGCSITFFASSEAGACHAVSHITVTIGQQTEDFETAGFKKFNWQNSGNAPWQITSGEKPGGLFAARSGKISDSERSELTLQALVLCTDTLSFERKVSSETGYDFLTFYMDGKPLARWSGNQQWTKVSFVVSAGYHSLRWVYQKDEATAAGDDAAWIDNIRFPVFSPMDNDTLQVDVFADPPALCAGQPVQLYALVSGAGNPCNFQWMSNGTLSDSSLYNPEFVPLENTTCRVMVTCGTQVASGSASVLVKQPPDTPDVNVIDGQLVSSATSGNQWYNSHGLIPGAINPVLFPGASGSYYVKTTGSNGCVSDPSGHTYFVYTGIKASADAFSVYPNPTSGLFKVEYTSRNAGPLSIQLYNTAGRCVQHDEGNDTQPGKHKVNIDARVLEPGLYTCKIRVGSESKTIKVMITK